MSAWLPAIVNVALLLAPAEKLALPASVTCSVPLATLSAALASSYCAMPPPACGSATATPTIDVATSSNTVCAPGTVLTGALLEIPVNS